MPQLPSTTMTTTSALCHAWELGSDCEFNVVHFHAMWAFIWAMTLGGLLGVLMRKQIVEASRRFVTLASGACFLNLVDSLIPLMTSNPSSYSQFTFAGSVLLGVAFVYLNELWCTLVEEYVGKQLVISVIRHALRFVSIICMPLAVVMIADSVDILLFPEAITNASVYLFMTATSAYLVIAIIRKFVIARHLSKVCNAHGLIFVSNYAILDQLRVLGFLMYSLVLRGFDESQIMETGQPLAAYAWFVSTIYWGIFLQVFLLFVRMDPSDPMCGHTKLQSEDEKAAAAKVCDAKQVDTNIIALDVHKDGSAPQPAADADPEVYGAYNYENWDVTDHKDSAEF